MFAKASSYYIYYDCKEVFLGCCSRDANARRVSLSYFYYSIDSASLRNFSHGEESMYTKTFSNVIITCIGIHDTCGHAQYFQLRVYASIICDSETEEKTNYSVNLNVYLSPPSTHVFLEHFSRTFWIFWTSAKVPEDVEIKLRARILLSVANIVITLPRERGRDYRLKN